MIKSNIVPMAEKLYNYSKSNEKKWMFLQDGARAHASKETIAWMN